MKENSTDDIGVDVTISMRPVMLISTVTRAFLIPV